MNNLKSILRFKNKNTYTYSVKPKVKTAHDIYYEIKKDANYWLISKENNQGYMEHFIVCKTFKQAKLELFKYINK